MGRIRINYFDVVGHALGDRPERAVGKAITALSAAYRAGRADQDFASEVGRAAYAWHHLPAHVSDLSRLFLDLPELFDEREELHLLGLGAGPGSEVLALMEAVSSEKARGDLEHLTRIEARRVDREQAWDLDFVKLLESARSALAARRCGLGEDWDLEAPAASLRLDLGGGTLSDALQEQLRWSDVCVAANLISELAPRGTEELPPGVSELWSEVFATLAEAGSERPRDLLLVDRAKAPGVRARFAALAELARASGAEVSEPRPRTTACGYHVTKGVKAIYRHVKLPTTLHEDRPVKNCQTVWCWARWGGESAPEEEQDDTGLGADTSPQGDRDDPPT